MKTETELDLITEKAFARCQGASIYDELRRLLSVINGREVTRILEIGSEEGGTLSVWLSMFQPVDIVNIDLNSYQHAKGKTAELEEKWKRWCGSFQSVNTVWGDSHDPNTVERAKACIASLPQYKNTVIGSQYPNKVDLLYIDGDHTEEGVEKDYLMYKDFVRPGGIIIFHDILPYPARQDTGHPYDVGVYKFWNRLKGEAVDMFQDRAYHKGLRPPYLEIFHDKEKQSSFGYGVIFC